MSHLKKLSAFRQLSLNCENADQRKKTLKKQFSEDLDGKEPWTDSRVGIKITLNSKTRSLMNAPPIKIAWEDPDIKNNETVIIKKCQEIRRTGKLSRQSSIEKDSILHSKQEIAERLQHKEPEKPNLKIFLAHNSKEPNEHAEDLDKASEQPKVMPPLIKNASSNFQIRKNNKLKLNLNDIAYSPTRTRDTGRNTVAAVPIMEKREDANETELQEKDVIKPIESVVIRPATAASRRERFQKRTNSAFHQTIKEPANPRPILVRSSSAPVKPEHSRSKFLANKRKLKNTKRSQKPTDSPNEDLDSPKTQKELNRCTAVNGNDVVTMVSLVSPAGSDGEEEVVEEKEKVQSKSPGKSQKVVAKEEKEVQKVLSLRKTVKSVSFQQSSIHAIRSFSASFPGRRASVATAMMMGHGQRTSPVAKLQEKRGSISAAPDDDETTPKRRLVRNDSEVVESISCKKQENQKFNHSSACNEEKPTTDATFSVEIKERGEQPDGKAANASTATDQDCSGLQEKTLVAAGEENKQQEEGKYDSPKEKQCWNMYCKMTEKGINVSFDTILRGMLTPTEYRISKKKLEAAQNEETEGNDKI